MLLYLLSFGGGVLTIVSPCILPVLPFVFSRADQPFRRSGLPLLAGMAMTFAVVAAVATVAGGWIVRANQIGRYLAIVVFAVLGLSLLFPKLAEYLSRPFVRLGSRVQGPVNAAPSTGKSLLLGVSTGLLWAPCAGPILGLILTGAAVQGANAHTAFLLLAFALGAACSLAVALLAGNRVFSLMKRSLGAEEWIRRGLGVAVLAGMMAIAFGWDQGVLQRISLASTSGIEQSLVDRLRPSASAQVIASNAAEEAPVMTAAARQPGPAMMAAKTSELELGNEGSLPSLDGAVAWLNSAPLRREGLKGKVLLVDFWTYSCINCLRAIPYVEAWAEKYKSDGLVVIGVHTPEFAFEKGQNNIAKAVHDLKISYPVAIDSNYAIWKAFHNEYWPAHYFIDRQGTIRYHHFGEGEYDKSELVIQQLLQENNADIKTSGTVQIHAVGVLAAPDLNDVQSPETYVGYARGQHFASPEAVKQDSPETYTTPSRLQVDQWGLVGNWNVGGEKDRLVSVPGKVVFRFHARDLHLVLGPGAGGKPIRFRVLLDGDPPGDDNGMDVDSQGNGTVKDYRLYQLIREKGKIEDRTFQIQFLDPNVEVFAFTFG
jgi:cytochrome c biogenesis protein CcdA/thiol-disulfide isomerase/thioredoxin